MRKRFLLTLVLLPFLISSAGTKAAESYAQTKSKAQELANVLTNDYGVTSVQYAVMDAGNITISEAYGYFDIENNETATKDAIYGIGSVSKMYVAASIMKLVDDGLIELNTPVYQYMPAFAMADERYKDITVRMLLNHSSGLYGTHYSNSILFNDTSTKNRDSLLSYLKTEVLKSKPGAYSVYCNDGFQLLELLVEEISGLSYTEYIRINFSEPLELSSTKTPLDTFNKHDLIARTYFAPFKGSLPVESTNVFGTGGIFSTAEEVCKFSDVLMGNKPEILSEDAANQMGASEYAEGIWPSFEHNTTNYGLGWDAVQLAPFDDYGLTALSKGGDTILYHSSLIVIPEKDLSIAVLSSGGSSLFTGVFATNVLLAYLNESGEIGEILPDKSFDPAPSVPIPEELFKNNGIYGTVGEVYDIEIDEDGMTLKEFWGLVPSQRYLYTGSGVFSGEDGKTQVHFENAANGHTYLAVNAYIDFPGLGQTLMAVYDSQKLETSEADPESLNAWNLRAGKKYYRMSEQASSVNYIALQLMMKEIVIDEGYVLGNQIVDANTAVNVCEIPVMNGRDAFDLTCFRKDNTEYLNVGEQLFISEDSISPIADGESICTIQKDGYARWYSIDKNSAGKTMKVSLPRSWVSSSYAVYDNDGNTIALSSVTFENAIILPEGGMVVFAGLPDDIFQIEIK